MNMGNFFLLFNVYTFHAVILFTFLNGQIKNKNSNCWIFIIIKPPQHTPSDILTSEIVNKSIGWRNATYTFQFLLNLLLLNRVNERHLILLRHQFDIKKHEMYIKNIKYQYIFTEVILFF